MSSNPRVSNGSARRRLVARLKAERRGCWICRVFGRDDTIDYSLPYLHPLAFTCDELKPVSKWREYGYPSAQACALDYSNVDAAHRACNVWRGNRSVEDVLRVACFGEDAPKKKTQGGSKRAGKVNPLELPQPFEDW